MPTRSRPIEPSQSRISVQSQADQVDQVLRSLFAALAPLLVSNGITPQRVGDLAKEILVECAAKDARMSTGRVNQSKVAALTGLSRTEIRQPLHSRPATRTVLPARSMDRCTRAIEGWHRDRRFQDKNGKPKPLPFKGGRTTFAELVRLHSGDVPPRVVLEQLVLKGVVQVRKRSISLSRKRTKIRSARPGVLSDMAPYVRVLLSTAATEGGRLSYAHKTIISTESETKEILLTEHIVKALAATASAMEALAGRTNSLRKKAGGRKLSVVLALTAAPPEAPTRSIGVAIRRPIVRK